MDKKFNKSFYDENGYFRFKGFFNENEIVSIRKIILEFHELWKIDNQEFFKQEAFNSSLITGSQYLNAADRLKLFNFISATKMMQIINSVIASKPVFMNTQLFFNPLNPNQKNFWHRDCQYDHDIAGQKKALKETQVVHFRMPLFDELGIELIPNSHRRWDSKEELNIRLEQNGKLSHEFLSEGLEINLAAGDLLVFSADMIHRGLYGMNRLALDVLIFDAQGDFRDYIDKDCLPIQLMMDKIVNPEIYQNAIDMMTD